MDATKCPHCGEELIEKADVCPKCGKMLTADTPSAVDNNSRDTKSQMRRAASEIYPSGAAPIAHSQRIMIRRARASENKMKSKQEN